MVDVAGWQVEDARVEDAKALGIDPPEETGRARGIRGVGGELARPAALPQPAHPVVHRRGHGRRELSGPELHAVYGHPRYARLDTGEQAARLAQLQQIEAGALEGLNAE